MCQLRSLLSDPLLLSTKGCYITSLSNSKLKTHNSKPAKNVPVANPAPNALKPRKLVTDLAALLCKGFSRFSEAGVSTLYEHLQEGSQTPLEIRSEIGFNKGTGPTRWGNQLNGNGSSNVHEGH